MSRDEEASMFTTILIANRGEIAVRVARTCRDMGIRVAAVYSTEDRDSLVVQMADRAVHIGPGPARRSYLNIAAVVEAARMTGADAIHPGYGFLSEDPDFAQACADNGISFIGPAPEILERLGDKTAARSLMAAAGLPLLPGSTSAVGTVGEALELADEIGYPVIIKAAAGGGGRGMTVVRERAAMMDGYRQTRATAQTLFGDSSVFVERYLESARHVEIQVLADHHGTVVPLGERDCSIQRRHQKLIEESPAPGIPRQVIARMSAAAVRGAMAASYTGVGTFEFLVGPDGAFYFLEVNPRIQVEHPVTESVTGLDLVAEQIRVAAGLPLAGVAARPDPRGTAIECRINAEDPDRLFAPTPGTLAEFRPPAGPFVRVDTHVCAGYRIPAAYDSLLAKVIVWAPDREQALARMRRALAELRVSGNGLRTTAPLLARILDDPLFCGGRHDTSFLDRLTSAPLQLAGR
jgi:acetyl-CoA carboxylase, biotin carboxylase subunit